jgi:hypothetical protein
MQGISPPDLKLDREQVVGSQVHADNTGFEFLSNILSGMGSTKQVIDVYRDWLSRCGLARVLQEIFVSIYAWKRVDKPLLVMIAALLSAVNAGFFLPVSLVSISCGFPYAALLVKNGLVQASERPLDDVQANLKFNHVAMRAWCDAYDTIISSSAVRVFRAAALWIPPLVCITLVVPSAYLAVVFLWLFLGWNLRNRVHKATGVLKVTSGVLSAQQEVCEVWENQRWWFGNWTSVGLSVGGSEIYPWSDSTGYRPISKTDVALPGPEWDWDGHWAADEVGWLYNVTFDDDQSSYHRSQSPLDFVRRRRWIRKCRNHGKLIGPTL